ncbi:nucleotidyltransferase family protein [Candidatus Woesearchaeota archaeon]|nr:nucleotidyltransferase family protein [Candidatus Woesearchaeota archaeon]
MKRDRLMRTVITNLKKQGVKKIALFGSYARNNETPKSDVDILVEFKRKKSLLELIRIERELSEKSGVKIDLLTTKSVNPLIADSIKKEMRVIYG